MEEILASIRQSLAREQGGGKSAPADRPATPLFSHTQGASPPQGTPRPVPPPTDRPTPSVGRLSDALKAHAPPPPSTGLGSKRPSSFDHDLADILDGPTGQNGAKAPAPKPSLGITPDAPGLLIPRTSEARTAAPAPQAFPAPSPLPQAPKGAEAGAEVAPPKAVFPMRRSGFYPPAGYTPSLPSLPPVPEPPPSINTAQGEDATNSRKHTDGVLKRLADLGAGVPASPPGTPAEAAPAPETEKPAEAAVPAPLAAAADRLIVSEPEPRLGPAPVTQAPATKGDPARAVETEPKLAPVSDAPRPGRLVPGLAESITAAAAGPEEPAAPIVAEAVAEEPVEALAPAELIIEAVIAEVTSEAETVDLPEPKPLESIAPAPVEIAPVEILSSAPVEVPAPVIEPPAGPRYNGGHYNGAGLAASRMPEPPAAAAKMALDALAQGLAAAASHPIPSQPSPRPAPEPPRYDPYAPHAAATLVPVSEPHQPRHYPGYPGAAPHMPAAPTYDTHQAVRTLEDTVADMLKPLLQQWLADNMPRIIEKALRVEAASVLKRGQKPPGA